MEGGFFPPPHADPTFSAGSDAFGCGGWSDSSNAGATTFVGPLLTTAPATAEDKGVHGTFQAAGNVTGGSQFVAGGPGDNLECDGQQASILAGDPIDTRDGTFVLNEHDLGVATGCQDVALHFERAYSTLKSAATALSPGWVHNYEQRATIIGDYALVQRPRGSRLLFKDVGGDVYAGHPGARHILVKRPGGGWALIERDRRADLFDADGKLIAQQDPNGNMLWMTYESYQRDGVSGTRLARVDAPGGRYLWFGYDHYYPTRLIVVGDNSGRRVRFGYDDEGRQTSATDPLGGTATYAYSSTLWLMTSKTNALGQTVFTNTYDEDGQVIHQTNSMGQDLTLDYQVITDTTTIQDRVGATEASTLSALFVTTVTDQVGARSEYVYGSDGLMRLTTDPAGATTRYRSYTATRKPTEIEDALGHITRISYNDLGLPTAITNALGQVTHMTYDSWGNPLTIRDPLDRTYTLTYDGPNLASVEDPLHHITQFQYESQAGWQNMLTKTVHNGTLTTSFSYDSAGGLTTITDPSDGVTQVSYDAIGRLQQTTQGTTATVNTTTRYAYDANSRVISTTVGLGTPLAQTTTYAYDSFGRVITTTMGFGSVLARRAVTHYNADTTIAETIRNFQDGQFDPAQPDTDVITTYGYDHRGRQVWVRDALGRYTATHYDVASRVDWTARNWTPFQLDSQGQPVYHAYDPDQVDANVATRYGFDLLGRTVLVTETGILTGTFDTSTLQFSSAIERVTRSEYDNLSRPITTTLNYRPDLPISTLPDVNVQTITRYDVAGNLTWRRDALGRWTHTEYDSLNRPITVTLNYENGDPLTVEAANRSWTDGSDTDLVSVTRYTADGQIDRRIDNYVDGVFTATEPITDRITLSGYDTAGRSTTTTQNYAPGLSDPALNRSSALAYDSSTNRRAGWRDALGRWVSQQYDALGRITATIQNCRDTNGIAVAQGCAPFDGVTAPDRNVATQTRYDLLGRVFESVDPFGHVTHTSFDGLGRATATIQNYVSNAPADAATNVATRQTYDALGQVLTATDVVTSGVEASSQYAYNGLGQTVVMTDTMGRVTHSGYDGMGVRRWTQRPDGRIDISQLDGLGRVVTTIQNYHDGLVAPAEPVDQDLISRTMYDQAGRRVQATDPAGRATAFAYDTLNRLIAVTENATTEPCAAPPCNVVTQYQYDRAGNRTAIIDALGHTRRFSYDAANQQTAAIDALGQATTYDYDAGGRVTVQHDPRGSSFDLAYQYSGLDQITETLSLGLLAPIGAQYDALGRRTALVDQTGTTSFSYDALGRVTQVQAPQTGTVGYGYDARGQRTRLVYPDGTTLNYAYWLDGQLRTVAQGSTTLADYTYDPAGRLAQVTRANGAVTTYGYDAADRVRDLRTIVASSEVSRFQYSVDRIGQRTQATETLANQTRTISYAYDGLLRLTDAVESPGVSYRYAYDLAGNRTDEWVGGTLTTHQDYNAANQVVGYTYDQIGNLLSDDTTTYSYDALSRLTARGATTYTYNGDGVLVFDGTTRYTQDLAAPLSQILQTTQGSSTTNHLYGMDRLASVAGSTRTWYGADVLGSVRQTLSDAGALLGAVNYDRWGTPESGSVATFGFTGELQDATAGLVNLRARWYSTARGTFTSVDPFAGMPETPYSLHRYAYGYSDPVLNTDPSGRCSRTGDDYCHEDHENAQVAACVLQGGSWAGCQRGDNTQQPRGEDTYECIGNPGAVEVRIPLSGGGTMPVCLNAPQTELDPVFAPKPRKPKQRSIIEILAEACGIRLAAAEDSDEGEEKDVRQTLLGGSPSSSSDDILKKLFENKRPKDDIGTPRLFSPEQVRSPHFNRKLIYAVTEDGKLLLGQRSTDVGGGHIDLTGGAPVRAAGEVLIVKGQIKYVNNSSGHYQPSGSEARAAAVQAFHDAGFESVPYKEISVPIQP